MTDLSRWQACALPRRREMPGTRVLVEQLDIETGIDELFAATGAPANADLWRYVPAGPFADKQQMAEFYRRAKTDQNWIPYVIRRTADAQVLGTASYMRLRPEHGSVEVGCVVFSDRMKRTPMATEAMYLMARHVFEDLGYRRYEWKCDNRNDASKRAAERLGFSFEGIFRQDMVVKGANRDTAWFSIIDSEWPLCARAFQQWLASDNFDANARQQRSLADIRASLV